MSLKGLKKLFFSYFDILPCIQYINGKQQIESKKSDEGLYKRRWLS